MVAPPGRAPIACDAAEPVSDIDAERLNRVFFALSDPVRRALLERLGQGPALVSELAAPFEISLQAVSRHIQVLVRAGLINQERSGRVAKCSLDAGPVFMAAVWINRYTQYWQAQFEALAGALDDIGQRAPDEERPQTRGGANKAATSANRSREQ